MYFWYILLIIILILCLILRTKTMNNNKMLFFVIVIILCFFAGIRTNIGDTSNYIMYLERTPNYFSYFINSFIFKGEWLFRILLFLFKKICNGNVQLALSIFSTVTITIFLYFFKKNTKMYDLAIYVFIASATYITIMNGVRQYFVAALLLASTGLIYKKKWYLFFPIIYLLSKIHTSALILFPVYFILNIKPTKKYLTFFCIFSLLLFLLFPLYNQYVIKYLTLNNVYTSYALEFGKNNNLGSNLIRVLIAFIPIMISLFNIKTISNKEKLFNIVFNYSLLNVLFYLLGTRHYIFARFSFYFIPFSILLLCWSIEYIKSKKNKFLIYSSCIFLYFIYYYYQVFIIWNLPYTYIRF